jgi:NNP family nitrate/nitrite transporter-like MFS transporter
MKTRDAWISDWNPEDNKFWEAEGKFVARRNLIFSILAEHIGFSIWLMWSIVVTKLPAAGFHYSTDQLFQLVALPGLIGSLIRFPYTFAVTTFGGRNWTMFSAGVLFIPTIALAYFSTQPDTPFGLMLLVAATAGLGGGNFASSMANISFFYPDRMKGWALGLNAAGGNIGVSTVQLLVPILMGFGIINLYQATPGTGGVYIQNAGLMWMLPLAVAVFCAWCYMNNLTNAKSSFADQLAIVKRKHTWVMSWIYIGTFGSFIGIRQRFRC